MRYVAVIPLRGGSKGILGKNVRRIAGRPLFAWATGAALESNVFEEVIVSTEDDEIACAVRDWTPGAQVVRRPPELATDTASSEAVMLHAAEGLDFDVMSLVQATSPLTTAGDFRRAREQFEREGTDSLVTGVVWPRFFWSRSGKPVNYEPTQRPRRQEMDAWLMENGAFYFTRRELLEREGCRLGGRVSVFEMRPESAVELDEPEDWVVVSQSLRRRRIVPQLRDIRCLFVDVDGTLTDGGMFYDAQGELGKRFDTRDWHGIKLLEKRLGVRTCIVTVELSAAVDARIAKVGMSDYHKGVGDKWRLIRGLLGEWGLTPEQAAYVGDDDGDLEAMKCVGFSACPADAVERIKHEVSYVCERFGGHGAVREVAELILSAQSGSI